LADELLSVAKRGYAGEGASLAWTDVTRHGTNDLSRVWKLDELIEQKERLAKIVTWGKSFKSNLERHTLAEPESVAHARLLIDFHRAGVDMDANIDLKLIAALLDLSRWWFS